MPDSVCVLTVSCVLPFSLAPFAPCLSTLQGIIQTLADTNPDELNYMLPRIKLGLVMYKVKVRRGEHLINQEDCLRSCLLQVQLRLERAKLCPFFWPCNSPTCPPTHSSAGELLLTDDACCEILLQ